MMLVTNIMPKKITDIESQAMLLVAEDNKGKIYLITVSDEVPVGTKIW